MIRSTSNLSLKNDFFAISLVRTWFLRSMGAVAQNRLIPQKFHKNRNCRVSKSKIIIGLWFLALKVRKAGNWPRTFYTGLTVVVVYSCFCVSPSLILYMCFFCSKLDAWKLADDAVHIMGSDNKTSYPLSKCHTDMAAFEKLTDSIWGQIMNSGCHEAISILGRILTRDFYKAIATITLDSVDKIVDKSNSTIAAEIFNCSTGLPDVNKLKLNDICVIRRLILNGKEAKNPVEKVSNQRTSHYSQN